MVGATNAPGTVAAGVLVVVCPAVLAPTPVEAVAVPDRSSLSATANVPAIRRALAAITADSNLILFC